MKNLAFLGLFISILAFSHSSYGILCKNGKNLKCSPDTLYLGDTLRVYMKIPHGGEMYIKGPDEVFYYTVFTDPAPKKFYSLYKSEKFKNIAKMEIITNKTMAAPWIYSKSYNELIFTKTGKYLIRVGDNLESEIGKYDNYEVYYINEKRKK